MDEEMTPRQRGSSSLILRVAVIATVAEVAAALAVILLLPEPSAPGGEPAAPRNLVLVSFAVSALVTLAALGLLGMWLRRETRGVARTARRLAESDFQYQPTRPTIMELTELTSTLDGMARQLTEHLRALNTQRSEQAAILRSIDVGVLAIDREQQVLSMNRSARALFHITRAEVRGCLLQELINEPELNEFVADALVAPTDTAVEFHLLDRPEVTVRATSGDLRSARNEVVGIVIVLNDVTTLRRLESMRSDFAANVSHELRTPMTNIKGYAETLLDTDLDDREQTRSFLKVIARNANRLGAIVEDMMALARLDRVESLDSFDPKPVKLRDVAEAAANALSEESGAKCMRVMNEVDGECRAFGNAQMMEQALLNLVSNAI
ncbi:MAG: PAS domain-containing protein, partial [Phycisphaerales bacterium]|nr:PAS domain-containing protein [Phycisphaerales bacterium]